MAHQSKDLGKTWTALGPTGLPEEVLTLDAERGILYAAGGIISPGSPIFRSTDDGATWSMSYPALGLLDLTADPKVSGAVWALGLPEAGSSVFVVRSTDGGVTWPVINQLTDEPPAVAAGGVFLSPSHPGMLYVLLPSGLLFASADGGGTLAAAQPPAPVTGLVVDPSAAGIVYAATALPQPVWRSLDHGAAWEPASQGLPPGTSIVALAIDPAYPSTFYAATNRGVWVTDNRALRWRQLGTGLPGVHLTAIVALSGPPRTVIVGTAAAGAYSITR